MVLDFERWLPRGLLQGCDCGTKTGLYESMCGTFNLSTVMINLAFILQNTVVLTI